MEIHNEFSAAKRKCLIISAMKNKVGLTLKLTSNKLYYLFKGGGGGGIKYKPTQLQTIKIQTSTPFISMQLCGRGGGVDPRAQLTSHHVFIISMTS